MQKGVGNQDHQGNEHPMHRRGSQDHQRQRPVPLGLRNRNRGLLGHAGFNGRGVHYRAAGAGHSEAERRLSGGGSVTMPAVPPRRLDRGDDAHHFAVPDRLIRAQKTWRSGEP